MVDVWFWGRFKYLFFGWIYVWYILTARPSADPQNSIAQVGCRIGPKGPSFQGFLWFLWVKLQCFGQNVWQIVNIWPIIIYILHNPSNMYTDITCWRGVLGYTSTDQWLHTYVQDWEKRMVTLFAGLGYILIRYGPVQWFKFPSIRGGKRCIMIAGLNMSYNPNVSPWVFGEMPCALLIWIMGSKLLSHVVLNLGRERSKGSYCGGFRNVLVGLPKLTKNTCPFDWGLSRCVITCDFLGLICSKFLQSSHDSAHIT